MIKACMKAFRGLFRSSAPATPGRDEVIYKNGPLFTKCYHCGGNRYPTEVFCPHCGYVQTQEVRGWIFTGPAAARVICDVDGKQLVPFRAPLICDPDSETVRCQHPAEVMARRVQRVTKTETDAASWHPVAHGIVDGIIVTYMVHTREYDNGRGGYRVERVTFPNEVDNHVFKLATIAAQTTTSIYMEA